MKLSPKEFGIPARTIIEQTDNTIAIVIDRKSRIIMADGKKILDKIQKIKQHYPISDFALKTTAPVCSKTRSFLEENNVKVSLV